MSARDGIEIVYDGECPFCASYVAMTQLKETVGEVRLIDAREGIPAWGRDFDLNDGMLVRHDGCIHYGADAVRVMAVLTEPKDLWNRVNRLVFRHPPVARILYPAMRLGRLATLRLLGRGKLQAQAD